MSRYLSPDWVIRQRVIKLLGTVSAHTIILNRISFIYPIKVTHCRLTTKNSRKRRASLLRNKSDYSTDICAIGNYALTIPGIHPVFLSETNCLDLIPIYSLHFHDLLLPHRNDYLSNVEPPHRLWHSKSTFKARIIHLWEKFKSRAQVLPPTIFIVNTDDGHGVHR